MNFFCNDEDFGEFNDAAKIMNNAILVGIGAILIGGIGGYVAGSAGGGGAGGSSDLPLAKSERVILESSTKETAGKSRTLAEIMREPGKTRRLQGLMDLYADLDPALFAAEAEKLSGLPFSDRILAAALLFSRWAEVAPEEAMAYAQSMGRAGFFVRPTVVSSWAATDPIGAAKYYSENPDEFRGFGGRGPGGNTTGQIAGEWAKQDPAAALEWAQGLEGREANSAVQGVFRELAITDPEKAVEMAAKLEGEQLNEAYTSIAREWASQDWSTAKDWISSLPAEQRDGAMSEAIKSLADTDPIAASMEISNLSDSSAIGEVVDTVGRNWSQDDPAAAAEWVVGQGTDNLDRAMNPVMRNWVAEDQAAALEFVNDQPEGPARDASAQSFVMANRDGNVQESLILAESIRDDEMRSSSVSISAGRWLREDPEAATNYLNETPHLSDEQVRRVVRRYENGDDGRRRGPPFR